MLIFNWNNDIYRWGAQNTIKWQVNIEKDWNWNEPVNELLKKKRHVTRICTIKK